MEIVDNLVMVVIPGAMHAGLDTLLFWGSLAFALSVAFVVAVPVNRYLLARGKGHARVHETGVHGGPPARVVGWVVSVAFVFGATVLVAEAIDGEEEAGHGGGHTEGAAAVRGLSATAGGMTLKLDGDGVAAGRPATLAFAIADDDGSPVKDFEVEHEKRMHLLVARRDLTGFQHLHPKLGADGTWRAPVTIAEPGEYRVFADFKRDDANRTLAGDLIVPGATTARPLPAPAATATTAGGYVVRRAAASPRAGREATLSFSVTKGGAPVATERYLGAGGHLVALREKDLAFLHVHPNAGGGADAHGGHAATGHGSGSAGPVEFATEFPSPARYRLFLQFKHQGKVRTAEFTQAVRR
jgi:hypothetical protein